MRTARTRALACLVTGCSAPPPASPPPVSQPPEKPPELSSLHDLLAQRSSSSSSSSATAVQGLVGVSFFDDMTFTRTDPSDPTNTVTSDLSDMPTLGFGGHYRMFGKPDGFEGGLDGTLLFSWARDSGSASAGGGGTIHVSTKMFIADVGFGVYGSQLIGDSVRAYVGQRLGQG